MARESCNLDKDEAEILKPSSPSSASTPPPALPSSSSSSPPSLFPKACEESVIEVPGRQEAPTAVASVTETANASASAPKPEEASKPEAAAQVPVRFANRCSTCRKKVGLTGFRCRCGDLFCGRHRYSSAHDCSFDYKTVGREEIAKANPLIRAAKIIKI